MYKDDYRAVQYTWAKKKVQSHSRLGWGGGDIIFGSKKKKMNRSVSFNYSEVSIVAEIGTQGNAGTHTK